MRKYLHLYSSCGVAEPSGLSSYRARRVGGGYGHFFIKFVGISRYSKNIVCLYNEYSVWGRGEDLTPCQLSRSYRSTSWEVPTKTALILFLHSLSIAHSERKEYFVRSFFWALSGVRYYPRIEMSRTHMVTIFVFSLKLCNEKDSLIGHYTVVLRERIGRSHSAR